MRTEKEIIDKIEELMLHGNTLLHSDSANALIWVLNYDIEPIKWTRWQQHYHAMHSGAKEPDFRLPIILEWIGEGKKILDCGVHNGFYTNFYAEKNEVIGIDLKEVIDRFKTQYKFKYLEWNVMGGLPFTIEQFDIVIAGEFIEHLINPRQFVEECHRVLKPKGQLMISSPYNQDLTQDPLHCVVINKEVIEKLFENLFTIKDLKIFNDRTVPGIMVLGEKNV